MNIQQLKTQIKTAFCDVDSEEYLNLQIAKGVEKHRRNFREYITLHPESSFAEWKEKTEKSVNLNCLDDHLVIGIFLLALDGLQPENLSENGISEN